VKEWLTIAEAALLVGRHPSRIYRWIDAGHLPGRENVDGVLEVRADAVRAAEATVRRGRPRGTPSRNGSRPTTAVSGREDE